MEVQISLEDARKLIYKHKFEEQTVFGVDFVKRSDKSLRIMQCRFNVKKYLMHGERAYNPKDYDLVCVFDMQKMAYRSIPLDAIVEIRMNGITYKVNIESDAQIPAITKKEVE